MLDAVLVGGTTALFGFFYYLVTPSVPPERFTALGHLAIFVVLWLAYRFVLFRDPKLTPGAIVTERMWQAHFETAETPMQCATPSR